MFSKEDFRRWLGRRTTQRRGLVHRPTYPTRLRFPPSPAGDADVDDDDDKDNDDNDDDNDDDDDDDD